MVTKKKESNSEKGISVYLSIKDYNDFRSLAFSKELSMSAYLNLFVQKELEKNK